MKQLFTIALIACCSLAWAQEAESEFELCFPDKTPLAIGTENPRPKKSSKEVQDLLQAKYTEVRRGRNDSRRFGIKVYVNCKGETGNIKPMGINIPWWADDLAEVIASLEWLPGKRYKEETADFQIMVMIDVKDGIVGPIH